MAKVYGLNRIELRPGVKAEDFEKLARELAQAPLLEGWKGYLLRLDRGSGIGLYLWLLEIESLEDRDRFSPSDGPSAEYRQRVEELADVLAKWRAMATVPGESEGTFIGDYVVVGQ